MSVYRDTNTDVVFEHPFQGPLTASVYRGTTLIKAVSDIESEAGRFTLPLTYRETQYDGKLAIVWTGTDAGFPFQREQEVEVRNPLAPISRLRTLFDNENLSDAKLSELENDVRLIIEAYTGQRFGFEIGTKFVVGTGEKRVALPQRLSKLVSVTGGPITYFTLSNDGWHLYLRNKNWLTVKEMPPEEILDNVQLVSGVIHVPDAYWKNFRVGVKYGITGEWGYLDVPDDVQEAALLLAKDFGSGENAYRDRYLETLKAGDWNLTFAPGAYRGTGNARADQLLEPYRRQGMVII